MALLWLMWSHLPTSAVPGAGSAPSGADNKAVPEPRGKKEPCAGWPKAAHGAGRAAQSCTGGCSTGAMQTAPVLLWAINCCAADPGCSGHRLLVSCAMGAVADRRFYTPCCTARCLLPAGAASRSFSLPLLHQASQGQTILGTQPERLQSKHHFFPVKGCVQPFQVTEQFPLCPAKRKQKEREQKEKVCMLLHTTPLSFCTFK